MLWQGNGPRLCLSLSPAPWVQPEQMNNSSSAVVLQAQTQVTVQLASSSSQWQLATAGGAERRDAELLKHLSSLIKTVCAAQNISDKS